ncbi:glycosyltransferase family 4 protein [Nitrosospira multiformis]|uniref:glycosyltransferase family 4 protein n=1 Tax=Nitrosospira multiformis TaxID=1231 RepID=UPI0020C89CB9|nr:glycosyltransferase family 4 protein [Nitrosospira multiformis]
MALLELLQGLHKLGVECLVFVPKKGPLLSDLDELGIKWRQLNYHWWWKPKGKALPLRILRTLQGLIAALRMAWLIQNWNCDLVYTNTIAVNTGALAAWIIRKPHIWHLHESAYRNPDLKFDVGNRCAAFLINRLSALIVVVSHSIANEYSRYIKLERMHVIYQSISVSGSNDNKSYLDLKKNKFQCVIVGSLQPAKGQDGAISAIAEVVRRGIDAHLVLVGDSKVCFRAELERQVKTQGLEHRVHFIGYSKDPIRFIRMADVVLTCSRWEAFSRVTIEAMLAGKAVISSGRGGTIELIRNGENGLLYEWGNHIQLANKIQFLYENPNERYRLGTTAHAWAQRRFTQERYANEVFDLLSKVVENKT